MAAAETLEAAWQAADRFRGDGETVRLGLFGLGLPETLVAATGASGIHVNFGAAPDDRPMQGVIEPFVDHEVQVFLNRFALGHFNAMAGIIFARDDAAALTAYQYAGEWVRQGRAPKDAPPLFLFNLVHADTDVAARFNRVQHGKLVEFLVQRGLTRPEQGRMAEATADAAQRAKALLDLDGTVSAATAARWRQAGRFMTARAHAGLLKKALPEIGPIQHRGPRLALVGSPIDAPDFHAMLDGIGALAADLQNYGRFWPGKWETEADVERMLVLLAGDPFCPRIVPPQRHRMALKDAILAARCDLVVCQLANSDDTFGWELPGLAAALDAEGVKFVHLGFRDHRPDAQWLEGARHKVISAWEAVA